MKQMIKGALIGLLLTSQVVFAQTVTGLKTDKYCWQVATTAAIANTLAYGFAIDGAAPIQLTATCASDNPSTCSAVPPASAMTTGNHTVAITPVALTSDGRPNPASFTSFNYTIIASPPPATNFKLIALISSIIGLLGFAFFHQRHTNG